MTNFKEGQELTFNCYGTIINGILQSENETGGLVITVISDSSGVNKKQDTVTIHKSHLA